MGNQSAMAGFIATICVTCEQCGHSFSYEQEFRQVALANDRNEAMYKVAKLLKDLRAPWRKGQFQSIKSKRCPKCNNFQSWMTKGNAQKGISLLEQLKGLFEKQEHAMQTPRESLPEEKCRKPTVKIRPLPLDLMLYTESELNWIFGIFDKEKLIFRPVKNESFEQVVQILEKADLDQLEILVGELRADPVILNQVMEYFVHTLANASNWDWQWSENSLGEAAKQYPMLSQGRDAATVLSAIGKLAVKPLISVLEEATGRLLSDDTQEIVIHLVAFALEQLRSEAVEAIPALINAMEVTRNGEYAYPACDDVRRALTGITKMHYLTHQEWQSWWESKNTETRSGGRK